MSLSPVGCWINTRWGWLSPSSFRGQLNEYRCTGMGAQHQRHSRAPTKWQLPGSQDDERGGAFHRFLMRAARLASSKQMVFFMQDIFWLILLICLVHSDAENLQSKLAETITNDRVEFRNRESIKNNWTQRNISKNSSYDRNYSFHINEIFR